MKLFLVRYDSFQVGIKEGLYTVSKITQFTSLRMARKNSQYMKNIGHKNVELLEANCRRVPDLKPRKAARRGAKATG